MSSLKKLAIRGAIWTFAGYGLAQALRLGGNLILTRLLEPELFGLLALATTFLIGLNLFSDIGIGTSIIQNQRGDEPDFLNTAWTMQIIRGFGLWLCCVAIAFPLASFYEDSRLNWILPLLGLTAVFAGFNSTSFHTLSRQISIGKQILVEVGTQIVSLVVMIVWAWLSPTVWALIGGNLVGAILKMFLSYFLIPGYSNRLAWDKKAVWEIFSFGKWIFVSTAMTFLATQADRVIIGKLLSFKILGIYTIAITFALLPQQAIEQFSCRMILPIVAQLAYLPREELRAKILKKRKILLASVGAIAILFASFGDLLVLQLYDERYAQAAWMLPILALGIWPYLLFDTSRQVLVAVGKPNYQAYGQFVKSIHVCLGLPIAYYFFGLPGLIIMVALNDIELYSISAYGLWRERLSCLRQDMQATLLLLIGLALVLAGRYWLGFGTPLDRLISL
ncbi:MAG: oligosaccharide flippase family protein [Hydrococcus sp. Prado102]|jgi:O-antigen/teichoic acid export membrane protein|nr:oligosaccharide flippase family protein [Hydrococcus sp. Prado102]